MYNVYVRYTASMARLPPIPMCFHRICNFDEPSNIGTRKQAREDISACEVFTRVFASCIQADLHNTILYESSID